MKYFFILLLLTGCTIVWAQPLRTPLDFKKAYSKGTRSLTGEPGPNYWQNSTDYSIKTRVIPAERKVTGTLTATYYNNSPDTLKELVIRLYQDLFKKGADRDFEINPLDVTDGTVINNVSVNGNEINKDSSNRYNRSRTNLILTPVNPLLPKSKNTFSISWEITLPKYSTVRMGAYDSTSFYVAYWYPQIAVYDDVYGWDKLAYTGQTEFYNDFNNYEVSITVPKNFLVWATGELQNPSECYAGWLLEKYVAAHNSAKVVSLVDTVSVNKLKTTDKTEIEYKYKASYVPDFVFALSDHYLWDASNTVVDFKTGRTAFISAAYKKQSKDFYEVAEIAQKTIVYFSTKIPGVPYPYPSMTVFNGGGGMEAPMMVNDGSTSNRSQAVGLTSHEIAHTYFPFYMGINERKFAWMDEGWAVALPFDFQSEEGKYEPRTRNVKSYNVVGGTEQDFPPITVSAYLGSGTPYRHASYGRSSVAYYFLRDLLGTEKFITALQYYMAKWNGKHPIPFDFFYSINKGSGEDLNWFFGPWFFEFKHPDLTLVSAVNSGNEVKVKIVNTGGIPLAVKLVCEFADGSKEELYKTAIVWKNTQTVELTLTTGGKKPVKVTVGSELIPDTNPADNEVAVN